MTASIWTYVYIVLVVANVLCAFLAIIKRNTEHLTIFAISIPMLMIGLVNNLHEAECTVLGISACLMGDAMVFK